MNRLVRDRAGYTSVGVQSSPDWSALCRIKMGQLLLVATDFPGQVIGEHRRRSLNLEAGVPSMCWLYTW